MYSVYFILVDYNCIYLVILDSLSLLLKSERTLVTLKETDDINIFFDINEWKVHIYKRGFSDHTL